MYNQWYYVIPIVGTVNEFLKFKFFYFLSINILSTCHFPFFQIFANLIRVDKLKNMI